MSFIVSIALCAIVASGHKTDADDVSIPFWPLPSSFNLGSTSLPLASSFRFVLAPDATPLLVRAAARYEQLILGELPTPSTAVHAAATSISIKSASVATSAEVASCAVAVEDGAAFQDSTGGPAIGADESYSLAVGLEGDCTLAAPTVWGALRAMETLTQALQRCGPSAAAPSGVALAFAPLAVADAPRFTHRGLLVTQPIQEA